MKRTAGIFLLAVAFVAISGCVERTMKITTQPPGAIVIVNDEEVGVSPVKFAFTWYGDYDLMFRKEGYQTLKTHHRVEAPWWQWPVFDLITETMIAGTIRDQHATDIGRNAIHGSDSAENAAIEIAYFFSGVELRDG